MLPFPNLHKTKLIKKKGFVTCVVEYSLAEIKLHVCDIQEEVIAHILQAFQELVC